MVDRKSILFLIFYALLFDSPPEALASESQVPPQQSNHIMILPEKDLARTKCIEDCIRRHQMMAIGMKMIEAGCRKECKLKEAVCLFKSHDKDNRIKGIMMLCESHDKRAVPHLVKALKWEFKERTGLWAWIIPALGELRDPSAVPVLVQVLDIPDDDWLAKASVAALGQIGHPSAIPALIDAAWRPETRDAAIEALSKFRDKRVIPVLISALQPEEARGTREAAMKGLRLLGTEAVPALIEAFSSYSPEHPDTQRRLWLCQLLGESKDKRAMAALHKALHDPDKAITQCAHRYSLSSLSQPERVKKFRN